MTLPWYPFEWEAYSGKTMHLTIGQHGAYFMLMRWIYTTSKPVPDKQRYSIARAMSEQERSDVDEVLDQFFVKEGDAWMDLKCREIMDDANNAHQRRVNAGKKGGLAKSSNAKAKPEQSPTHNNTLPIKDKDIYTPPDVEKDFSKNVSSEGQDKAKRKRLYDEFPLITTPEDFASKLPAKWQAVLDKFIEPEFHSAFALGFWDRYVGAYPGAEVSERYPEKENWFMAWEHAAENSNRKGKGLPPKKVFGSKTTQAFQQRIAVKQ